MAPGEQGIATKEFDMLRQKLIWGAEGPISIYEWSKLDLGAMLHRRPAIELLGDHGQPIGICTVTQMPRLILDDGASLSVQAGGHLYCSPRDDKGPYTKVEVGFPSETPPEAWKEFAEEWDRPTNTVYGYVPLNMVMLYIGAHGGIDRDATFKDYKFEIR